MMRLLPSFLSSNPVVKATGVAVVAGTFAGLVVIACTDSTQKTITAPPSSPRSITGIFNAGNILVCVDGPAGEYRFTTTGFLSNYEIGIDASIWDGADGGNGETTQYGDGVSTITPGVSYEYAIAPGPANCKVVLTRTRLSSTFPPDDWSGITVTATTIPPTSSGYTRTDCLLDAGVLPAIPYPCGTGNNPTRVYANGQHGAVLTFVFGTADAELPTPQFVIGDLARPNLTTLGTSVNFWGSQWWKNNPMSLLSTKGWESFKGYASSVDLDDTSLGPCGKWFSRVGNSPPPPPTITNPVPIIVTTNVVKNGPNLEGGILQILLVTSDLGYGPNPGHAGNGLVTTIVCGEGAPN